MTIIKTMPNIPIAEASDVRAELAVEEISFGNGFTQRLPRGTGGLNREWQVKWEHLTSAEINQLEAFFVSHRGSTAFYWTPPLPAKIGLYICRRWQHRPLGAGYHNMTAQLVSHTQF